MDDGFSMLGCNRRPKRLEEMSMPDLPQENDRPDLLDCGRLGADYLARQVGAGGRFCYHLDPVTGTVLTGYNLLRHAGALLALARWAPLADGPGTMAAIARAADYLLDKLHHIPTSGLSCLASKGRAKLGGTALLILALLEIHKLEGSPDRLALCRVLADYLISQQDVAGDFRSVLFLDGVSQSSFNSNYYPGQAVLALTDLYNVAGDDRFLGAALRGAGALLRREPTPLPRIDQADHWTIMALEALHRHRPDPAYAVRVLDGAARIQELLIVTGDDHCRRFRDADYGSGPAATRGEALAAAWRLARRCGEGAQADAARGALAAIIDHCLAHQWRPGAAVDAVAIGGFRRAPDDPSIRIDIVQHVILAIDGLLAADSADRAASRTGYPPS